MAAKKLIEINATEEVSRPSDFALTGGVPAETYVSNLFTSDNTSLVSTIEAKGTAPDAHLEVPTNTENLKLIKADNSVAWQSDRATRYNLSTTAATTIVDRQITPVTLNAASVEITLPTASIDGKAMDALAVVTNTYAVEGTATEATLSLGANAGVTFAVTIDDGATIADTLKVAAGKKAIFTFTQIGKTTIGTTANCPVWLISKKVVADVTFA